jgi:hypothetical protein
MKLQQVRDLIATRDWHSFDQMLWFSELECGWYPVTGADKLYDDAYFDKFEHYSTTLMGKKITHERVQLVKNYYDGPVVDVGVGSCHFMDRHDKCLGFDVSSYGIKKIIERDKWCNPYEQPVEAITCWDSFEHIKDCWALLENVQQYVFISIPYVLGAQQVLKSKHYKPNEHWWYLTVNGLIKCFGECGFACINTSHFEESHGRSDIVSCVFKRI